MHKNIKNKLHHFVALLFCLFLLVPVYGCGEQDKNVTEITLIHAWGSIEDDHVAMRQIYRDFELQNPDIHINLLSFPTTDELIRKVEDSMMVGEIPDIMFLAGEGRDSIYQYMVNYDYALNLMPYIEQNEEFRSHIAPSNLKYWTTSDNELFTISDVLITGGGYWYNKDIFAAAGVEQVPKTWEEFEQVCKQIELWSEQEHNDVNALQLSTEGYLYFANHILAEKGLSDTKGFMQIEQDKMMDTLNDLQKIYTYSSSDNGAYNYRDETSLFNDGKLAIYVNGVWGASMISEKLNVEYALLPSEQQSICCESSGIGYVLGRTGDSAREQASVRFLEYMLSPEVQERILLETQQVPANPHIAIENFQEQMPRFCQAVSTTQNAEIKIEVPRQLWSNQQFQLFKENIIPVLSGKTNKQTLIDLLKR